MSSEGKSWEKTFEDLVTKTGCDCVRFHDTMYNYKGVANPCDFVISISKNLPSILVELKSCEKTSFQFNKFTQLDDLKKLTKFNSYLIIWFTEYKKIVAINTLDVISLIDSGVKSLNPTRDYPVEILDICCKFKIINPQIIEYWKLWGLKDPLVAIEPDISEQY